MLPDYSGMRFLDEIPDVRRMPVISPGKAGLLIHPLLHHRPFAVRREHERMQVDLESVGDAVVIDLRGEPAGSDQFVAI